MKRFLNGVWKLILGILLFALSIVLLVILFPWGLVEMLISFFWRKKFREGLHNLGELFLLMAVIVDVSGNVILKIPLNRVFNTNSGYKFGSRFDTISYVLGHGLVHDTLSKNGFKFAKFLDRFERDHCIKTYYNRHPELNPKK